MAVNVAKIAIQHIENDKFLDAIQCLQNAILEIEVTGADRRKIRSLTAIMDKISEAAMFGSDWDEGRRAKKAAILKLQKVSAA
ncbi:hypothetical protein EST62_01135 [Chlorobaculum sp. 24CR]|uniref:hypothetical protein n=1 Tax=Chlorobaculum sp. 24CR TaxID=2508878 RepID=UPI00100A7530|nr:hypothetical protein [Chlorobaculum sp. 24CR]RXK88901.1 hypothetical protein EST62_01135 [Chlorobaculum sp. 24CR]